MPITSATLRRLAALSLNPEQMAGVLTLLAEMQEAEDTRLEKQRARKRKSRDKDVTVTGQERDETGTVTAQVSPKERSPTPPKEITPSPSLRSDSFSARADDADLVDEFTDAFWPVYPHKVGKPAALKAFRSARKRASLTQILSGLQSYIREKPPDRQWLNPATFLNQDRFDDQPANPPTPAKPKPHDTIFRALAQVAREGGGERRGQADADERRPPDGAAGEGGAGPPLGLAEPGRLRA